MYVFREIIHINLNDSNPCNTWLHASNCASIIFNKNVANYRTNAVSETDPSLLSERFDLIISVFIFMYERE